MTYPALYGVTYSYTGFQQAQGDNSFPGTQLDADLAGLQSSISGLAAFVEQGFRSDGALANGSVGYDQLSPSLQLAGISAASAWLTGTAYVVGAGVVQTQKLYRCAIAHISGVFATDLAAGKWIFVANIGDLSTSGASVAGHLPIFSDTTAKLMADSGVALSSLATTTALSAAIAGLAPLVSPVFTTPNIGVATGTSLALSPTASTLMLGLSVAQTLPAGTAAINTVYSANLISIVNSGYQTPPGGANDPFGLFPVVSGFRVNYQSAGSGVGQFPIHIGGLFATKATSAGLQLVGLNGAVYSNIDSSGNDSFWSLIGYANIGPSANINGVYGVDAEVAVSAGALVNYRIGVLSSSLAPTRGSIIDSAFAVVASVDKDPTTAPWHNALVLWKNGADAPIDQSVITTNGTFTAQYCIKLDTLTFANKIFDFGASIFQTDGSGNTIIGGGSLTLGVAGSNVGKSLFKNATSGTLTVQPPTGALGTVTNTLQAANDTFVYRATVDTLTNKSISGATNTFSAIATASLACSTTNDNAAAGNLGEIITSTLARASATAITTATPKTVTSISLTAGDWEVDVVCGFNPANTTSVTQLVASMSLTTNVLDTAEGKLGVLTVPATVFDGSTQAQVSLPPFRFSLAATTTVYLVAQSNFTVSTSAAFGVIKARRVR